MKNMIVFLFLAAVINAAVEEEAVIIDAVSNVSNVNEFVINGEPVLFYAARNGYLELVRVLLNKSTIDVNLSTQDDDLSPLAGAIMWGKWDVALELLSRTDLAINKKKWDL